jgi:ribosome-binding factor A
MKVESRRQKRIGSMLQEILGPILIDALHEATSDLVTVTRVDVPADLKTARIYVSAYGPDEPARVLELLVQRSGAIRRSLASSARLKYNPQLFFALDPSADLNERIERLLRPNEDHDRSAS